MFPFGDRFDRTAYPGPPDNAVPNPESAYNPIASSLPVVVPGVDPELTACTAVVVPDAEADTSITDASAAADTPAYSLTATPTSADPDTFAVTVGLVPPPALNGALHTLNSVLSEPVKCLSSV
jgi:hypothetical protein